jgi:hypothetical protein
MDAKTIATLNALPPPTRKSRYLSAASAHARIVELESHLNLPHSKPEYNLSAFNRRIDELESQVERMEKTKAAAPSSSVPVVSDAKLRQLHTLAFGEAQTAERLCGRDIRREIYFGKSAVQSARAPLLKKLCGSVNSTAEYANARKEFSALLEKQRVELAGTAEEQRLRLARDFANAGIAIPGLETVAKTESVKLPNIALIRKVISQNL